MNRATLYGIRPGQDEDAADGVIGGHRRARLTPLGVKQAGAAAYLLIGKNISAIYASHFQPALKTAVIISAKIKDPHLLILPEIKERIFGELSGQQITNIPKMGMKVLQADRETYFLEAEGAETFPELYERMRKCLIFIYRTHVCAHSGKDLLIVSHGDVLKMLRAIANRKTWREGLRTPYIDNAEIVEFTFSQMH